MGWAGPATEEVGPISAQNGWADLGLTLFIFFIGAGPDLAQNFGLGQIRPDPTSTTWAVGVNYNSRSLFMWTVGREL